MLSIKHLSKKFHNKYILDSVSLDVKRGEIALLLGPSGVGKSTLLRILNNLEKADAGSVFLDGKALDLMQVNQLHTIGMVFQHFNLFENMTVIENITFPLIKAAKITKKDAYARAHELLCHYGLESLRNVYTNQLSGGQKQRLALARSLALKPQVLCLDEPTSALDPFLKDFVAQNIHELAQQQYMVLVATHDVSLIQKLQGTLHLMEAGKIVESADGKDFFQHPHYYPLLSKFMGKEKDIISHKVT